MPVGMRPYTYEPLVLIVSPATRAPSENTWMK